MSSTSGVAPVTGRSPLAELKLQQTHPAAGDHHSIVVVERPLTLAMQVIARHGAATATAAAIKSVLGVELPNSPRVENGAGLAVIWSGPDQWIVMADLERGAEIEYKVREAVSGLASCVDQSHSRVQIGVSGAHASDVLSKLVTVDLDPSVFAEDMVAMTVIAHIPVYVWRSRNADGTPAFEIAGPQSYAESLWHHVVVAAAEYGVEQRFTTPSITQARS